ncbi:hypothetical protein JAAARDRAFT_193243 [Jaapia argillacea MUCL 33604]|uniref:Nephrocystin 3-like N-terminal domain-containing protein n=1 Tax=Jaapia argillacea MUCL 33604 TaxID=933084 RepID=A0A067Q5E2_9AGAM|nr:hypothetical protein JAAARDRAFT_193243 [Jaapia argillacea MUCL 33604]
MSQPKVLRKTRPHMPEEQQVQIQAYTQLREALWHLRRSAEEHKIEDLPDTVWDLYVVAEKIQITLQAGKNALKLSEFIKEWTAKIGESRGRPTFDYIRGRVFHLYQAWEKVLLDLRKFWFRNLALRAIGREEQVEAPPKYRDAIDWSIHSFVVEGGLRLEFEAEELFSECTKRTSSVLDIVNIEEDSMKVLPLITNSYDQPPRVITARYDYGEKRSSCLKGTRIEILHQVRSWIDCHVSRPRGACQHGDPAGGDDAMIFWISGMAGTGKTTLAYTVADECYRWQPDSVLGATFFFDRQSAQCRSVTMLFNTIAYQLGTFHPPFRSAISVILQSDPTIVCKSVTTQIEELIVKPLDRLRDAMPPCVIVLDALDECSDSRAVVEMLSALARNRRKLWPLKFLITGRPLPDITASFASSSLREVTQSLSLHDLSFDIATRDTRKYLSENLKQVKIQHRITDLWPSDADLDKLARLSQGHFAFAAAVVNHLGGSGAVDPILRLQEILAPLGHPESPRAYRLEDLDTLYSDVVRSVFSESATGRLKTVLGTLAILQRSLPANELELLLDLPSDTVRTTLKLFSSVVLVPEWLERDILLIHPTFADFLLDPPRTTPAGIVFDAPPQHTLALRGCLRILLKLERSAYVQEHSWHSRRPNRDYDFSKLPPIQTVDTVPLHVQYASRYWAVHLSKGLICDEVLESLADFSMSHLLAWLEVCSRLGEQYLREGIETLNMARCALSQIPCDLAAEIVPMLSDCERLVLAFLPAISADPLQVYHSALPFAPTESVIRKNYRSQLRGSVWVRHGVEKSWTSCLKLMEGHDSTVTSLALSPDGSRIISGSLRDVRLWNVSTGSIIQTFTGIAPVAFSPNGDRVLLFTLGNEAQIWHATGGAHICSFGDFASRVQSSSVSSTGTYAIFGCADGTVQVWNTRSLWDSSRCAHLRSLRGQSDPVSCVAISPDERYIATGSNDQTVRLWETSGPSDLPLRSFQGHSRLVSSVAFSPDGAQIVSGSWDSTLRLWDVTTGTQVRVLKGHSSEVNSVAFSFHGTHILSASSDQTVQVWNATKGSVLRRHTGHTAGATVVVSSFDGSRLASGSVDCSVRLWDSAKPLSREPERDVVYSVALSTDRTRIASGFRNSRTAMVWDTSSFECVQVLGGHTGAVNAIAFSGDGDHIATGSFDNSIRLWNLKRGGFRRAFTGHEDCVSAISFSPGGDLILSGSWDHSVRLWNRRSGQQVRSFEGHSGHVTAVAFAPDGTRFASGSDDHTVRIWDCSGVQLCLFKASNSVLSVSFTPDSTSVTSTHGNGTLSLWNINTEPSKSSHNLRPTYSFPIQNHKNGPYSAALSQSLRGVEIGTTASFHRILLSDQTGMHSGNTYHSGVVDLPHLSLPVFSLEGGWLFSTSDVGRQRVCWLPVDYRHLKASIGGTVILGHGLGGMAVLDTTMIPVDDMCDSSYWLGTPTPGVPTSPRRELPPKNQILNDVDLQEGNRE